MRSLNHRLLELERRSNHGGLARWHRILRYEGQTEEESIVAYEAQHGPIGPDEGKVLRVIIHKPFPAPEVPCAA